MIDTYKDGEKPKINGAFTYHEPAPPKAPLPLSKYAKGLLATVCDTALIAVHWASFNQEVKRGGARPDTLCDSGLEYLCDTPLGDFTLIGISAGVVALMSVSVPVLIYAGIWHRSAWGTLGHYFKNDATKPLAYGAALLWGMVVFAEGASFFSLIQQSTFHPYHNPSGMPYPKAAACTALVLTAQHIVAAATAKIYASIYQNYEETHYE